MRRLRFLLPLALLTLFFSGCREDLDLTIIDTEQEPPAVTEGTVSLGGVATNNEGAPLANVTVELVAARRAGPHHYQYGS